MYDRIEDALGNDYLMFFHPAWPCVNLTPVCNVDQCLAQVNFALEKYGTDLTKWADSLQNQIAKLFRVSWILQRLSIESIRKPILVHKEGLRFVIDCGDTRLMAKMLSADPGTVPVVATCKKSQYNDYMDWIAVESTDHLKTLSGFDNSAEVLLSATQGTHAVSWLEIGDQTTAHHLHDESLRLKWMQQFINLHDQNYRFSREWFTVPVDQLMNLPNL